MERDAQTSSRPSHGSRSGFFRTRKRSCKPSKEYARRKGSPILKGLHSADDAYGVERLRKGGRLSLSGKPNAEVGLGSAYLNPGIRITRNAVTTSLGRLRASRPGWVFVPRLARASDVAALQPARIMEAVEQPAGWNGTMWLVFAPASAACRRTTSALVWLVHRRERADGPET